MTSPPAPPSKCVRCGDPIDEEPRRDHAGRPLHPQCFGPAGRVRVTGVDIPFLNLVAFFIKLALAGIPALLIIGLVWFVLAAACWPDLGPLAP